MPIELTGPLVPKNDAFDGLVSSKDVVKAISDREAGTKTTPVPGDKFLLFDSEDGFAPKLVDYDDMPGGETGISDSERGSDTSEFIIKVVTTSNNEEFRLPLVSEGSYAFEIYWG